jgi:glyoxylase-like metal-dependent hydrolase (beta-lactamase superfamily II)/rhodanese-related sulfurtransferase
MRAMSEITADELKRRLERPGSTPRVVDIRPPAEFEAWHIEGAINVPVYDQLKAGSVGEALRQLAELPSDRPVVTVCRGGFVSKRAAQILGEMHREAASLMGGMRGWGAVWTEARVPLSTVPSATLLQVRRNGKGCLSYVLSDGGEAAVVDPSVAVEAYLELLARLSVSLKLVLETHVHADHLSRARALAERTGATLVYPENGRVRFPYHAVRDGDRLRVGGVEIEVLATPGHTGESVCYRLAGEALLTGDTLFTGAVGRPDLEKGNAGAEAGARLLWHSLHERLLALPPSSRVLPAHHATAIGFDGVPVAATLGEVRERVALVQAPEETFVADVLRALQAKPPNFERVIAVNEGKAGIEGLDPLDVEAGPNRCAVG